MVKVQWKVLKVVVKVRTVMVVVNVQKVVKEAGGSSWVKVTVTRVKAKIRRGKVKAAVAEG